MTATDYRLDAAVEIATVLKGISLTSAAECIIALVNPRGGLHHASCPMVEIVADQHLYYRSTPGASDYTLIPQYQPFRVPLTTPERIISIARVGGDTTFVGITRVA